jgi:hypothetical protein
MWILGAIFFTVVILLVLVFCWALVTVADKPMLTRRAAKRRANKAAGRVLSQAEFNQMYANGRPTMPSQAEPKVEHIRRRRECECEYCMEPTLRNDEFDPPSLRGDIPEEYL